MNSKTFLHHCAEIGLTTNNIFVHIEVAKKALENDRVDLAKNALEQTVGLKPFMDWNLDEIMKYVTPYLPKPEKNEMGLNDKDN